MAKHTDPYVLDGAASRIAEATALHLCAGQPATYAEATTAPATGKSLGSIAMTPGIGTAGSDYSLANGDTSGRKVTVAAQTGIGVATSGTADHVALVNTTTGQERLLHVTTMPAQAVTAGNTANTAAWDAEFNAVTQ